MAGSTPVSLTAEPQTSGAAVVASGAAARPKARFSPAREALRRFRRHRLAMVSSVVLSVIVVAVLLGPLVWRVPINEIDFAAKLEGPSWAHPFGTDDLGQDVLARLLYGGRVSLAVGLCAMLVAAVVGVFVGAIAGMSRGAVDAFLMWLADLFLSLPALPLLLLIIYMFRESLKSVLGPEGGVFVMIVAVIGGLRWMQVARLVRAQILSIREKEFIEAARMTGASDWRIIRSHILPHLVGPIIVFATLVVAQNILAEAGLSFLGLGIPQPTASWGNLLSDSVQFYTTKPLLMLWPGLAVLLATLAFNLLGDGLRDAFDPRSSLR